MDIVTEVCVEEDLTLAGEVFRIPADCEDERRLNMVLVPTGSDDAVLCVKITDLWEPEDENETDDCPSDVSRPEFANVDVVETGEETDVDCLLTALEIWL